MPTMRLLASMWFFFFFNDTATTEIYTLSLHDALPISDWLAHPENPLTWRAIVNRIWQHHFGRGLAARSEEHTSELQSRENLVCRLLLEKKKKNILPQNRFQNTKYSLTPK